ncbi:MAG TPA: glycoside hydrolase domain-containing protein [Thermomicrobiaceae bacterium]|nr:glycoside hydrolase domain-containing protein [Thermomicrobiaceae bacterium]
MAELGVDRASPPTSAELALVSTNHVAWVGGYVGGVNNGGRAWTPADADRVRAAGLHLLPIYVGENVCDRCKTPVVLTAAQGTADGNDAVACASRYACRGGPLALDVEYATYTGNVAGALAYAEGWTVAVAAAGYLPVVYAILQTAHDYQPRIPTGLWIADWDGVGDLAGLPNAGRFSGVGWQYADNWHGFDVSHADGRWWGQPASDDHIVFPQTGHGIGGGFYQFWAHHGGVPIFGYPLTDEVQEPGADGKPITVQWFERARFEWHPGADPANWDVVLGRLGAEALVRAGRLGHAGAALRRRPAPP